MKPKDLAHIFVDFLQHRYGTVEFLQQLATIVSMNAERQSLQSYLAVPVFDEMCKIEEFRSHAKVLLENTIIPQVNRLNTHELYVLIMGMLKQRIGQVSQFDLLATQFARAFQSTNLNVIVVICKGLAEGDASSESCFKTIEALVFSVIEAATLKGQSDVFTVPEGLYTEKQVEIIKMANTLLDN